MDVDNPLLKPVTTLKGVGSQMTQRLNKLGILQVQDLLYHLPIKYQDRTRLYAIGSLEVGQEVIVEGFIEHTEIVMRKRRMMLCQLSDGSGNITLRFFHFSNAQFKGFSKRVRVRCFGEIRQGPQSLEIVHPEYKLINDTKPLEVEATLTPIYPTTEGIQQRTFRRLTSEALKHLDWLEDLLPETIQNNFNLPNLHKALRTLHSPTPETDIEALIHGDHPAQKRLIFEELLAHHLSLRKLREQAKKLPAMAFNNANSLYRNLLEQLPFKLTNAQHRVIDELYKDMQKPYPMHRLVQGDVGSGKTLVAAAATLFAIENGFQVALMAPTEILAEQHYQNFRQWLEPMGFNVSWISASSTARLRRSELENLALGLTHLVVGTHALFQSNVHFKALGLVIIDEQHRFGVNQRLALREKGKNADIYPHQLIMTATPIPRTLAMTTCADLDYSVIDELPPGRLPVTTVAIPNSRRDEIIQRIHSVYEQGRQVYWVCTLIEESDTLQCQAAEDAWELLKMSLPDLEIGLVHGRMKPVQKEAIMRSFKKGATHLLVATTVIEVGVDVPNASLMVIENAERLGLAQLHQLRGRVGRGGEASSCILLYQPPLSKQAHRRLDALRNSTDGFEIAQIDLEIRGPGEVFGTRQTGELRFRVADLARDQALLPQVHVAALQLQRETPLIVESLIKRWIHRADEFSSA